MSEDARTQAEMAGISILDGNGNPRRRFSPTSNRRRWMPASNKSGVGPCLDASRLQRPIHIDDMSVAAAEYPDFARLAQERGVQSTLSLPLIAGESGVGAMNLYAKTLKGFSEDHEVLGCDLAAAAAIVLAYATAYRDSRQLPQQLTEPMQSRAVIEQAEGVLMARSPGITAEDAFHVLQRASQRENVKLRDIATGIVERRNLSGDE